jgi:hypothetical protein
MFNGAIEAHGRNFCRVVLLKLAKLYSLVCPATLSTMVLWSGCFPYCGFAQTLKQTDQANDEETDEKPWHRNTSLMQKHLTFFAFLMYNPPRQEWSG